MLPQILPQLLDADMAQLVAAHLQEKGMRILTSKPVEEFLGEDKVTAVMAGGEKIEADLFVSSFGVRANTETRRGRRHTLGRDTSDQNELANGN